jgi:ATP-dependent RNA helicase DeaD
VSLSKVTEPLTDGFESLGLGREVAGTVVVLGYEEPTSIQREAIPPFLAGRDLLGQAATGTGKTAAFALPLIQQLTDDPDRRRDKQYVRALILVPTREPLARASMGMQHELAGCPRH